MSILSHTHPKDITSRTSRTYLVAVIQGSSKGSGGSLDSHQAAAMQRICSKQRLDELRTSSRDSLPYPVENEPPLVQKCRDPGYTGGELNLQPSLWFMAAICCFSASATAFLEAYVLSASGPPRSLPGRRLRGLQQLLRL